MTNEDLIRKYRQTGDQEYRDRLVLENLGLIHFLARKFSWAGFSTGEIVSMGAEGILRAADEFDPESGRPFSSYMAACIRREFSVAATKARFQTSIGASQVPIKAVNQIPKRAAGNIANGMTEDEAFAEASSYYGISAGTAKDILQQVSAGYVDVHDIEMACDPGMNDQDRTRAVLLSAFDVLNDRERDIVARRILAVDGETLEEIARDYGVSLERIRQIQREALGKMETELRRRGLRFDDFALVGAA
ncbi:sigma-70 family RNA polymerase sigma factor [Rhodovulum euryhalinum]|uniref:RNA polymerase sigma factor (Sigma-70 family) n=1 Tax=Rhodovulum euryhalinum TaxID=35805 RepID=A0A4R2KI74_9RHOB|nr:sigma-70 family RNA polymerase sigma factor [Rhodovulum euryhalinum]TCO70239.1 RNA polymerase sigma factor (sigma-70 family) [Rhodovulum euryhalinum]